MKCVYHPVSDHVLREYLRGLDGVVVLEESNWKTPPWSQPEGSAQSGREEREAAEHLSKQCVHNAPDCSFTNGDFGDFVRVEFEELSSQALVAGILVWCFFQMQCLFQELCV